MLGMFGKYAGFTQLRNGGAKNFGRAMTVRLLVLVGFGLLVAIIVIVGRPYLLSSQDQSAAPRSEPNERIVASDARESSSDGNLEEVAPRRGESTPPPSKPGARARAYVKQMRQSESPPDLEQAFARAQSFREAGEIADAHILLFYAAREGHAASARELAGMYDPLAFSAQESMMDEPVPAQAYKWYRRASEAGDELASERLSALRNWAQAAAAAGDPDAQELLTQWH